MNFFGREDLIESLMSLWGKRVGSLCTCRGRRRIGKSTLIEHFARLSEARFIRIEGVKPQTGYANASELRAFAIQLSAQTDCSDDIPTDWLKAFIRLDEQIDDRKTVVLIDEVSWLGHYDAMFADIVKLAWDNYWKKHDNLIVVLCGSVSSWIREQIIDNSAFMGRRSLDIVVKELPLRECVKFWGVTAARINRREIVDVLSVTGGVPRYLEEVDPGLSADENIRRMAFSPRSTLRTDFDEMFADVITRQQQLTGKILRTLKTMPLSVSEIADALGIDRGGKISEALQQLEEAGLVAVDAGRNPESGVIVRERRYRLRDNYTKFYLNHIEPRKAVIDDGSYGFVSLESLEGWNVDMGYAFENLVVNNYLELLRHLHLGHALVESAAPFRRTKNASGGGVQVDLMLQTRKSVYLVEIKRKNEIGREVEAEIEQKESRIALARGKSFRRALVYEGHLAPIVEADGYFDAIIPFRRLLGL